MTVYILLFLPLAAAAVSGLMPRGRERAIEYIALAVSAAEFALAILIGGEVLAEGRVNAPLFETDALGSFVILFATFIGLAAAIHSVGHLREEARKEIIGFRRIRQYFVLFHLFFLAMFLAAATSIPLITWVAIEATTLATAFLISFYNKPSAIEAGWKQLIINSVGLLLGFLGTLLFLNAAAGAGVTEALISWDTLYAVRASLNPLLVTIAFIFVVVGYGTKVGFVPMHTWLPDAHSKAPAPISSLLSGVLLNVALVAILRFRFITDAVVDPSFSQDLLIGFGIVSIVLAALIIFAQKNYKRMLAYSSIENMGVIALGAGIGGAGMIAALFHMLYHALLKSILFFSAGNLFLKYGSTKMARVRGAITIVPVSAVVFFAALLAVAGTPPSGIFFTKLTTLALGVEQFPYVILVAVIALGIVFAGFVKHATTLVFGKPPEGTEPGEANNWTLVSLLLLSSAFVILSLWMPPQLRELIYGAASIIQ